MFAFNFLGTDRHFLLALRYAYCIPLVLKGPHSSEPHFGKPARKLFAKHFYAIQKYVLFLEDFGVFFLYKGKRTRQGSCSRPCSVHKIKNWIKFWKTSPTSRRFFFHTCEKIRARIQFLKNFVFGISFLSLHWGERGVP